MIRLSLTGIVAVAGTLMLIVGAAAFGLHRLGARRGYARGLVVAAVTLILAVGAAAFGIYRTGERNVHLEVTSRSGTVSQIQWSAAGRNDRISGQISTPWGTTVRTAPFNALITIAATSTETDEVTCRIVIDGEPVAESTGTHATSCAHV